MRLAFERGKVCQLWVRNYRQKKRRELRVGEFRP
jgi:hypothetical protein